MQKQSSASRVCLWGNQDDPDRDSWHFTTGSDRKYDQKMLWADIAGSTAHIHMLGETGIIPDGDRKRCMALLRQLYGKATADQLQIPDDCEDVHAYIESLLTDQLGKAGERIHSGRSRNDQVLLAIRLFLRRSLYHLTLGVKPVFTLLIDLAGKHMGTPMPGYTHMQVAMPSTFGLWFACFAESLADDLLALDYAYSLINQNPLGTAAGYGSSFPINREMTTRLLGFKELQINPVYAQMSRGKSEKSVAVAIESVALTLSKLAHDICLYSGQNFGFVRLADEFCTGSSIMPHKRNPDVAELVRGNCNELQSLSNTLTLLTTNLPTGYHRDLQLIKGLIFPAMSRLSECLGMTKRMLENITVEDRVSGNDLYRNMYTVEAANKLVREGMSFRKAYQLVAAQVKNGEFIPPPHQKHNHTGSLGNPGLEGLELKFNNRLNAIPFLEGEQAIDQLMNDIQHK